MPVAAGPKVHKDSRYDDSWLPRDGPQRVIRFLESLNMRAGPLRLRPFQKTIIRGLYRRPRPRQALVTMGRQNGKSALAAWIGLYALVADRARNPVIACVANSERQAKELWLKAVEVMEATPALEESCVLYHDRIEYRAGGTRLQVFASSPAGSMGGGGRQIRGISAHLVIVDELAYTPDPKLWQSVLWPTILADPDGMMLGITTPGYTMDGPAWTLRQRALSGDRDRFFAKLYEADADCRVDDRRQWKKANPALGYGLAADDLAVALVSSTSEAAFRREHLGQWTTGAEMWIGRDRWDALAAPREVEPGTRIFAAFDGSWSADATAIVACTEDAYLFPIEIWEKPQWNDEWRVPRPEVEDAIERMFHDFEVVEFCADPSYWESNLLQWQQRYGPRVLEFPPTRQRMAPACVAFAGAVGDKRLSHSGDERLARHIANAVVKPSPFGDFITKAERMSPLKIDAAIAAVIAHHRSVLRRESRKLAQVW